MEKLNEREIKKSLIKINKKKYFKDWFKIVKPILLNEEFQKRRLFAHHKASVWDHSIKVSYNAYVIALGTRANARDAAIGGLLHDFYPQAWRYSKELEELDPSYLSDLNVKKKFFQKHGFIHAREASKNYVKYFNEYENKVVTDCILKHMFPLNIKLPKYKESWIVSLSDKIDSFKDMPFIVLCLFTRK